MRKEGISLSMKTWS